MNNPDRHHSDHRCPDTGDTPPPPYDTLPRLTPVRWLHHHAFYDGPLTGLVTAADLGALWAECVDECANGVCGFHRRYSLTRLTVESAAVEARWHRLFQEFVGMHCDYDDDGNCLHDAPQRPRTQQRFFYEEQAIQPAWKPEGEYVGWFQT